MRPRGTITAAVVGGLVVAVAVLGCSQPRTPDPPTDRNTAATTTTHGASTYSRESPKTAVSTPSTHMPVSGVTAPAPLPYPARELFVDPQTVAKSWMAQWCATDYHEPRNYNVQRAAAFATSTATAADLAAGDSPETYSLAQQHKLSRHCGLITAVPAPQLFPTATQVAVVIAADRVELADGQMVNSRQMSTIRRVVRIAEARWIVDIAIGPR